MPSNSNAALHFLDGGSAVAALMRARDWRASPLGSPETWPQALRLVVDLMLNSKFPMFIAWGSELGFLYNDAYAEILGDKHPNALGGRFSEIWQEIWSDISPLIEGAMAGEASYREDMPLIVNRHGRDEHTWFTFSYSPVRDDSGTVCGMFCACNETTKRVLAERAERESESRLRLAVEGAKIGTWDWDLRTARGTWSPRTMEILGATSGTDITPEQRSATIHPDDRGRVWREFQNALDTQTELVSEYRVIRPDGEVRWIASRGAFERDEAGVPVSTAGIVIDVTDTKTAEASARASEARLRELTNALPAFIWFATPNGDLHYFNDRWYEYTGQTPQTALPNGWAETLHPDDVEITAEKWADARARGVTYEIEVRYRRQDGVYRWYVARAEPIRDASGTITTWVGSSIDIHERKEAENALRDSEARFRLMADALPQIVWVYDAEGRNEFFNKQWFDYTGASSQAHGMPEPGSSYVHPEDVDATMAAFAEALAAGTPFIVENRLRSRTGDYRWFLARAEPYRSPETGEILRWFGGAIDIQDQKLAEARLRELNDSLELQVAARSAERERLWNLSQDMLARADYSGMMTAVSPAWSRVLGWSQSELLSRPYATLMHPEDMPPTIEAIGLMGETGQPTRFENRIATSEGGYKPIEWTVTPEPDGVNFIAVGRDLSLAKAREAELHAAHEALRQSQKMEAIGSLTGGVAHDFNNLLTPIIGSLDMLVRREIGSNRERRLIDGALQAAERAKTLVQRLLAFARRQPLQSTAVDLGALVQSMAGLIGSTVGPAIDLRLELASDLPLAQADLNQLEMALLNLTVNARDAMPDGGELTIASQRDVLTTGHSSGLGPGEYVRLSVRDTGYGMDDETLQRAIEPFFSTKGVGKGTGLGLSMVHGLAGQLGGALTIESAPQQGTTATLWLPVSRDTAGEGASNSGPAAGRKARGTALLVDDELLVRMSTCDMLEDLGFAVVEASSGDEAFRLLRSGTAPDLLVTDHLMPGMTGADLAREARSLVPGLPVLIVSGYAEVEGLEPDIPRLIKPFRNAELEASLAALAPHLLERH